MAESQHIVCPHCDAVNRVARARLADQPVCGKCAQALFTAQPTDVSSARFDKHVQRNDIPVLVDFWAAWCGPCRMMAPSLNEIATEREGRAVVAKVDVDANPELAAEYNIRAIPALYIFSNGKVVDTVVGVRAKSDLLQHLDTAIANHAATLA